MARKPAQLVGGKGPRQRIWEAIRRLARSCIACAAFTEDDIWHATEGHEHDIEQSTIRDYRRALVAAGILEQDLVGGRFIKATYTLAIDEGIDAPRVRLDGSRVTQGLAQEQMWRTLRMLKSDTNARELAAHASTPAVPVAATAANKYLQALNLAGFMIVVKPSRTVRNDGGKAQARYCLKPVANTGPRAPMVCRAHVLYDPNTDQTHAIERVTEEVAIYGK